VAAEGKGFFRIGLGVGLSPITRGLTASTTLINLKIMGNSFTTDLDALNFWGRTPNGLEMDIGSSGEVWDVEVRFFWCCECVTVREPLFFSGRR
jgi:hypothetical protein